jgi:nucleoside 2-deoxyribosyltransferase
MIELTMLKIYLAGPDVFETDAIEQGRALKELCRQYGFEGLFPLDNEIAFDGTPYAIAKAIREANIALLKECDLVMANLNPFRGLEPDSGTVYEVGYAAALGKKVYGYAADLRPMIERVREEQKLLGDATLCQDGKIIEDFGLSHNLMMIDVVVAESAEACLKFIETRVLPSEPAR